MQILDDQVIEPVAAVKEEEPDADELLISDDEVEPTTPTTTPRKGGKRRKALLASYEPDKRVDSWLKVRAADAGDADRLRSRRTTALPVATRSTSFPSALGTEWDGRRVLRYCTICAD